MPTHGKYGGGGAPNPVQGLYTCTASSTGIHTLGIQAGGYLTEVIVGIFGSSSGTITGGPVLIRAFGVRGDDRITLTEGYVNGKRTIQGTGSLNFLSGGQIVVQYDNKSAADVIVFIKVNTREEPSTESWYYDPLTFDTCPVVTSVTANPAAGAQPAAITVTTGRRWRLLAVGTSIVTDANVADRYPYVGITMTAAHYYIQGTPITANVSPQNVTFAAGASPGGAIGNNMVFTSPLGTNVIVNEAGTIQLNYLGLQATDDSASVRIWYQEVFS